MDAYFMYLVNKLESIRVGTNSDKLDILRELRSLDLWRGVAAEFVATLLFVLISTLACVAIGSENDDVTSLTEIDKAGQYVKVGFTFILYLVFDKYIFHI